MRTVRFRRDGEAAAPPGGIGVLVLQLCIDRLVVALAARHKGWADRLSSFEGASVRLEPSDLPFVVLIAFAPTGPRARLMSRHGTPAADAVIRAPLHVLLDIAEGRADGDGLFFARALSVAGDTGLIVALRNALDDTEIDLAGAVAEACGPLGRLLRPGLVAGRDVAAALSRIVSAALPQPAGAAARHG